MIVHQDKRASAVLQRPLDDLAGIDGRMIHCALGLHLVGDQDILAVEIEHAEFLGRCARHGRHAIIDQRRPGRQGRLADHPALGKARGCCLYDLELIEHRLAHAFDFHQAFPRRGDHFGITAEARQKPLGQRLGVFAGNGGE